MYDARTRADKTVLFGEGLNRSFRRLIELFKYRCPKFVFEGVSRRQVQLEGGEPHTLHSDSAAVDLHPCSGRLGVSSVGKEVKRPNIPAVRTLNHYSTA